MKDTGRHLVQLLRLKRSHRCRIRWIGVDERVKGADELTIELQQCPPASPFGLASSRLDGCSPLRTGKLL